MITPFTADGAVDVPVLQALTEWYIASGVSGLFANCLSSEMYDLSDDERVLLARTVKLQAAGRVPVVACGTFGGSIEQQAAFINRMSLECDAVVVVTSQLAAQHESDEVWLSNTNALLNLTKCPLGLYECPLPYKRLLTPEIITWAASTNRFCFHKDTCCSVTSLREKIAAASSSPSPFRFYNANVETLLVSNSMGGAGFSGISANFYPWMHARLCSKDVTEHDAAAIQRFLSVAELVVCDGYPKSAKAYLALHDGFPIQEMTRVSPASKVAFNEVQRLHLMHLRELMGEVCSSLQHPITPIKPIML